MSLTFPQAATKLHQVGTAFPTAQRRALQRAATVTKDIANATGGRMRNIGRRGANLTASYRLSPEQASVKPRPAGAWHIAESGAKAHLIGAGRGRRRAIGWIHAAGYDHPVRGPIEHPGARGRGVWTKTVRAAERAVPPVFDREMINGTIRKVF